MACQHRVPGVVDRSLSDLGVDDDASGGLRTVYQMATLAQGRCLLELEVTTDTLAALEHPWMVVKGPVLVELGYGDPGARLYEDLDIVVDCSDMRATMTRIEASGGQVTDFNWPMAARLRRAEVPMLLPAGMLADIHWHLLVTPSTRARFRVSMAELFERRRVVRVGGIDVPTLDPVDGILYLCLHGSLSGGHQLVWLRDLDAMVESEPPNWDELVRGARRARVDLVAAVQLDRARSVLGSSVPEAVVEALAAGSPWWRWWRWREHRTGMARWGGYDRTGRTFMAATSHGSLASSVQLAWSNWLGPWSATSCGPRWSTAWAQAAHVRRKGHRSSIGRWAARPRERYLRMAGSGELG
jgi:hypothetical protein